MQNPNSRPARQIAFSCILLTVGLVSTFAANTNPAKPNVLFIVADDLGYGDVKTFGNVFGTSSIVPTPRMDSLATQGMIFTDMHACAAICSSSRYGILTGRYSWRLASDGVSLTGGEVGPYGQPAIRQGEVTIAQFLKNQGYDTAAFGKWHLGAQWYTQSGVAYTGNSQTITDPSQIDLVRPVTGHATSQGFNSFYGYAATINHPPYLTMVNDRCYFNGAPATPSSGWVTIQGQNLVTGSNAPDGVGDPNFNQRLGGPDMISHAVSYLSGRASASGPFFAYVSLYSPHLPLVPTTAYVGSSGQSNFPYGDYIVQTDAWIGQLVDALGSSASNTIIVVCSDNGPEDSAFLQAKNHGGHDSNGPFKGIKRDSWEGGHRVPFIVSWPGKVAAGTRSTTVLWEGDFYATMADYLGVTLAAHQAADSVSFLPILLGTGNSSRTSIAVASNNGQLSLTTEDGWKVIDGTGGGGKTTSYDANNNLINNAQGTIGGTPKQLFQLPNDVGERTNVQSSNPTKVTDMMSQLNAIRTNGN